MELSRITLISGVEVLVSDEKGKKAKGDGRRRDNLAILFLLHNLGQKNPV